MFAVLKTGGKQYKVQAGDVLRVEKLDAVAGDKIQFNDILMVGTTIGAPMVKGAAVQAEVIDQIKGEKTIHYVKRRRKHSSQRTKGHRQHLTLVRVTDVLEKGAEKSGVKAATGTVAARRATHEAPGTTAPAVKAEKPAKVAKAPASEAAAEKPKRAAKAAPAKE
jgi:large subunit ribosomal protein L21